MYVELIPNERDVLSNHVASRDKIKLFTGGIF